MKTIRGYTETELRSAVRQERLSLTRERISLIHQRHEINRRLDQIDGRLVDLTTADELLENGL